MRYRATYLPLILSVVYVGSAFSQTLVHDLAGAIASGNVALEQANGTGASSGSSIVGVLQNRTNREINIDVYLLKPIYLKNHGVGQNMVASQIYSRQGGYFSDGKRSFITLKQNSRSRVSFVAYCAEFEKENPTAGESFSVVELPTKLETVMRNITAYARNNPNSDVTVAAQVGVWLAQGESNNQIGKKFKFTPQDEALARTFLK